MKLWPTKRQWQRWSLPSKLTAIGALLTVISLGAYTIEKVLLLKAPETEQSIAERGILLLELGYTLCAFAILGSLESQIPEETVRRELKGLYARLRLPIPKVEVSIEMLWATRSMLINERDRHFLDVGRLLILAYGLGGIMIHHKGTDYEVRARAEISDVIHNLKTALRSLGLLAAIERERQIESYLTPTSNTTKAEYSQALDALKAAIVGEIRQQYGTYRWYAPVIAPR